MPPDPRLAQVERCVLPSIGRGVSEATSHLQCSASWADCSLKALAVLLECSLWKSLEGTGIQEALRTRTRERVFGSSLSQKMYRGFLAIPPQDGPLKS